ncbi:hypothetical protein A2U01_0055132, partial [Trifolium medium]|nr:hypothetical protein [Trifolium medium]
PQPSTSTPRADYSWVADEPRNSVSVYAERWDDIPEDMFTDISSSEDWEVRIPGLSRRICTAWGWGSIPMYQMAFQQLGYRMPFTDLETAVFGYLRVSPSQLHPNSLAFLRAFEVTAGYLEIVPTLKLFFHAFGLQRSCPKGE